MISMLFSPFVPSSLGLSLPCYFPFLLKNDLFIYIGQTDGDQMEGRLSAWVKKMGIKKYKLEVKKQS